ncbi:carboxypeptidase regulatory-like domain-containing protein [Planctomicrobium sp. SH664]|uniref:carboxypeptidase regulatory-like domain-containing protein n=1 Tax=Planctomicrobium sp. SH664 TaxID=3448125 RepID=UPI003F5AEFDD
MRLNLRLLRLSVVVLATMSCAGCGDSNEPKFGEVSGLVTLDGKPLPYAILEFQKEGSRPSIGKTDLNGKYSLKYSISRTGAVQGNHNVWIEMGGPDEGEPPAPGPSVTLPRKYNVDSLLTAEVKAGNNEINFALDSK